MRKLSRFAFGGYPKRPSSNIQALENEWFDRGNTYWSGCQPTNDGMLGGYGHLHDTDIEHSRKFLNELIRQHKLTTNCAIDCGAGIGRVTKSLLSTTYKQVHANVMQVDLVDQSSKLIETAKLNLAGKSHVGEFYVAGLQNFQFTRSYDCVWVQWGLCNLPQPQAFKFLEKARNSISKTSGIVFIKENEGDKDSIEIDVKDCTVVRTHRSHLELFDQCGFKLVREMLQPDWPADLYDVRMYCLTAK